MDGWNTNSFSFELDGPIFWRGFGWEGFREGSYFQSTLKPSKTTHASLKKKNRELQSTPKTPGSYKHFTPRSGWCPKIRLQKPKNRRTKRLLALQRNSTFEAPSLVQPSAQCIFLAIFFTQSNNFRGGIWNSLLMFLGLKIFFHRFYLNEAILFNPTARRNFLPFLSRQCEDIVDENPAWTWRLAARQIEPTARLLRKTS